MHLTCRSSAAGGLGATLSTFPQVPLSREPTCTQPIDQRASGSTLTPADTSRPSWSSRHFPDFPWPGSQWLAHGSPFHGDWFPHPTGLLFGVFCPPSLPGTQPRDVSFPFATPRHPTRPIPGVPRFPVILKLLCGPCHTLFLVLSPFPIPHAMFIPHRGAGNRVARAHWILIHPGTFSCALHGSFRSRPLVFGWFDSYWTCLRPFLLASPPFPVPLPVPILHRATCIFCVFSGLPRATMCHLPAAPFRVPCTDCCYLFSSCLFALCCVPSGGALWFLFFFLVGRPPPPSLCAFCLVVSCPRCACFFLPPSLNARTSALHWSSAQGSHRCSSLVLSPSPGMPLGGPRPCQVGGPPSRHSSLIPLSSPLPALPASPVCRLPSYCRSPAPCALSSSLPRQGCISRALTRLSASALSSVL